MTEDSDTIVVDLPAKLDGAAAAALAAEMRKLPPERDISLNAAAVTSLSPGYLQVLISAFRTFPRLSVSEASVQFVDAFALYGVNYPIGASPAAVASAPDAGDAALAQVSAPPIQPAIESLPIEPTAAPAAAGAVPEVATLHELPQIESCVPPLPAAEAASAELLPEVNPAAQSGDGQPAETGLSRSILTIDDSRTMRDMLNMALSGAGFTVHQAVDGQDGLNVLAQQHVDLVITDINMPKLDGYGVIRAIRSDPAYDSTPILVLSTEAEQESKDIAKDAGATGWIVKPFDPDGLVKLVNAVCG
jgi:two-component system, chemotaxis family, chemotaxis protein CheY